MSLVRCIPIYLLVALLVSCGGSPAPATQTATSSPVPAATPSAVSPTDLPKPPVWTPAVPTIERPTPPIPTPYHATDDEPLPLPNSPDWKRIEAVNGRYPTKGYAELLLVIMPENAGWSFQKWEAADSFPATPTIDAMWVREDKGTFTLEDERELAEMFTLSDSAARLVRLSDGVTEVVAP